MLQTHPSGRHALAASLFLSLSFLVEAVNAAPIPAPPAIAAKSHILMDSASGRILSEQNAHERLEPASLTKIMTAYVVFHEIANGHLSMDDEVLVSEKAWKTGGSKMFIEVGKRIKVSDLVRGMIIQSGNDACVALAEHIAGSEDSFAGMMNQQAARLGMTDTHFLNATGLPDPQHYSSAADMALLGRATIRDFPDMYPLYAEKEFLFNGIRQHNRNLLLWRDDSVDGIKTGHTEAAGYCLVASAQREGMRLIAAVMGTASEEARAQANQALLNYGFRFFETHRVYAGGAELKRDRVWLGENESVAIGVAEDLYLTLPRREADKLEIVADVNKLLQAPISKGETLGRLTLSLEGEELASVPLVALEDIAEGGFFSRMSDHVMMLFE